MPLKMRHPDIATLAEAASEDQFHAVWAPRGWELVPAEVILAADHFSRNIANLEDLTVDELRELAGAARIEAPSKATKPQLVKLITDSKAVALVDADNTDPNSGGE